MKILDELICGYCGDKMVLMFDEHSPWDSYYYHYSRDYSKGCHQRISVFSDRLIKTILGEK